jgi:hypothetical protein
MRTQAILEQYEDAVHQAERAKLRGEGDEYAQGVIAALGWLLGKYPNLPIEE